MTTTWKATKIGKRTLLTEQIGITTGIFQKIFEQLEKNVSASVTAL